MSVVTQNNSKNSQGGSVHDVTDSQNKKTTNSQPHKTNPHLRFPEFNDDWEEKLLGEIVEIVMGQSPHSENYNDNEVGLPLIQGNADITKRLTKPRFYTSEITKTTQPGDLILTVRAPAGYVAISNVAACIGRGVCAIKKKNDDLNFVYQFLLLFESKWTNIEQGTTFSAISGDDIRTLKLNLPSLPEQEKIAGFLSSVDRRIELLKSQLALLQEYKQGVMQRIFDRQIRFQDDNGDDYPDWEERLLGEIGEIVTGKTPPTNQSEHWQGDTLFVTPTDIIDANKYQLKTARKVSNTIKNILPPKSIHYTCIASIGKMSFSVLPSITNQQINTVIPNKYSNSEFVYYSLVYLSPKIKSTQSNTTLPIINKSEFSKIEINLPSLPEQEKIAGFLSGLDDRIEVVGRQIAGCESYKQALLQQMFV